jgi:TM2 domain-containing membrane protein YozV
VIRGKCIFLFFFLFLSLFCLIFPFSWLERTWELLCYRLCQEALSNITRGEV